MIHMTFTQHSKIHIYNAMMTEGTDLNLHSTLKVIIINYIK